jgi:2-polyprenyl-6-methoxyphenol hydroxylase-like FAD-dependent oxidoreductase
MKQLDIAVCGCGPAGLAAALLLHRTGHRVRIFERFETPRPVGSGLIIQPTGLGVLAEMGLVDQALTLGTRIDRLFGRVTPSNRIVLDVRYEALGSGWHGLAMHRAALFGILHRAIAAAGVEIKPGVEVGTVSRTIDRIELVARSGSRLGKFDLIVDALGTRSPLAAGIVRRTALSYGALWTNVPWPARGPFLENALEQRYYKASRMAGLLPIGKSDAEGRPLAAFFWSLKRDGVEAWRSRPLAAWKQEVAQLWPEIATVLESIVEREQLVFAQYDHFTARSPYSDKLVHIGDAARSTSPQLGQGANMAMLDALALARALQTELALPEQLRLYARMRARHVRLFQAASAIFTPFYQSDSRILPRVRDWFAAPLSRLPVGDALLVRLVSGMTVSPLANTTFTAFRDQASACAESVSAS